MPPSEQDQFLSGLKDDNVNDPFASFLTEQDPQVQVDESNGDSQQGATDDEDEESILKPRNRRERRLESRLREEQEFSRVLAARLQAETAAKQQIVSNDAQDSLAAIERIYGVDSPEAREATQILRDTLLSIKREAVAEAKAEFERYQSNEVNAVREAESQLDTMLEEIEDEFDVDLTSRESADHRRDYLTLLEKMSPKDRDGNITQFADHRAVWEIYQSRFEKPKDNTAKNLASRGMQQSNQVQNSNLQDTTLERQLRELGII